MTQQQRASRGVHGAMLLEDARPKDKFAAINPKNLKEKLSKLRDNFKEHRAAMRKENKGKEVDQMQKMEEQLASIPNYNDTKSARNNFGFRSESVGPKMSMSRTKDSS